MNKKIKTFLWISIIAIVIFLLALPKLNKNNQGPSSSNNKDKPSEIPVTIVIAKSQPLNIELRASGTILANEEVELKAEASGKVTGVFFREGSEVTKGKLLIKVNDSELQAQLKKLELRIKLAEDSEKRSKSLIDKGGISQAEYDAVMNELNVLKADRSLTLAQIEKTEIKAPFNGTIGLKNISEGSYISPASPVASLQDISKIKIDFSVPEKYASKIKAGNKIVFTVAGLDQEFSGEIYAIDPKIDPTTRTVQLRAIAINSSRKIFPGAFADIKIVLDNIPDAIMIPTEAIIPIMKGQKVFLYKNGKAEESKIEAGIRKEIDIQIVKGVQSGDTVITSGILQLKSGAPVKLK